MKKITPFLWFDTQAEEAMNFYISVFKNGKVLSVSPGANGIARRACRRRVNARPTLGRPSLAPRSKHRFTRRPAPSGKRQELSWCVIRACFSSKTTSNS